MILILRRPIRGPIYCQNLNFGGRVFQKFQCCGSAKPDIHCTPTKILVATRIEDVEFAIGRDINCRIIRQLCPCDLAGTIHGNIVETYSQVVDLEIVFSWIMTPNQWATDSFSCLPRYSPEGPIVSHL